MKMKNISRLLALALSIMLLFGSVLAALPVSAAYITNGEGFSLAGDANGDGEINVIDMVRLKKMMAGVASGDSIASDLNANGKADSGDLVMLTAMLLEIDESKWTAQY